MKNETSSVENVGTLRNEKTWETSKRFERREISISDIERDREERDREERDREEREEKRRDRGRTEWIEEGESDERSGEKTGTNVETLGCSAQYESTCTKKK